MKTPENWQALIGDEKLRAGLYLTAMPIGNLGDITLRALDILIRADEIWAEDTRNIRKLMSLYGIVPGDRKILACHDHNEGYMSEKLVEAIHAGKVVAYVSDAGMPLISDPGFRLVNAAIAADIYYTILPGASSVLSALVLSGAPSDRFGFYGFIPSKSEHRERFLREIAATKMTAILFESANRLTKTIGILPSIFDGQTRVSVIREISKTFEEIISASVAEMPVRIQSAIIKGEIVIVIEPEATVKSSSDDLKGALIELLKTERLNDAVKIMSSKSDWSRNEIYEFALTLKNQV